MRFPKIVPKTPGELERFYLDVEKKLGGTDTTLADEEKKRTVPFINMVNDLARQLEKIARDMRNNSAVIESLKKQQDENRLLQTTINRLERRILDIERQL